MSRLAKLAVVGAIALILGGCFQSAEEPEGWGEVEDGRLAELQDDSWLRGTPGGAYQNPYGWYRPSVERERPAGAEPWRDAAAEVGKAEAAGWVPVFVRCSTPQGLVQVDLVRELSDSSPATARIVAGPAYDDRTVPVEVWAVALHHHDGDWVQAPPATAPADFDAGTCLDDPQPGYDPRWSGTPVMFDLQGDSPPAD